MKQERGFVDVRVLLLCYEVGTGNRIPDFFFALTNLNETSHIPLVALE
ncbi:MAG: hypothetical protein IH853_12795 [Bacteroidetes bacterium]|nr:hypothetical protein [Bacteroidota bacterium]